jgi:hypothetical protein
MQVELKPKPIEPFFVPTLLSIAAVDRTHDDIGRYAWASAGPLQFLNVVFAFCRWFITNHHLAND